MLFTAARAGIRDGNKPFRDEPLSSERLDERALALAANFTIDPQRRHARSIYPRLRDNAARPRGRVSHAGRGRPRRRLRHAGHRVVPRQLPPDLVGDRRDPRAPAAPLLPRAAGAGHARAGGRRAHLRDGGRAAPLQRQPARSAAADAVPQQLSARRAADPRRAVGVAEHVEAGADREPAPAGRRDHGQPRRAPRRRRRRRAHRRAAADAPVTIPDDAHDAFVVQLLHRAREYDMRRSPLRAALERTSPAATPMAEDVVRVEHQQQAASQASVANAITSLRLCTTVDWREYVEVGQPRRERPAPRSGGRVLADGFPQPRSPAPGGRGARRADRRSADPRRAQGGRDARARRGAVAQRSARGARRLSPDRQRPRRSRARSRRFARSSKPRVRRRSAAHATRVYLGASRRRPRRCSLARRWPTRGSSGASASLLAHRRAAAASIPASELAIAFVQQARRAAWSGPSRCRGSSCSTACRTNRKTIVVDPDAADQRRGRRVAARAPRGRRDRQPRSAHPLRDPQRLRRRRHASTAGDDAAFSTAARAGIDDLNARAGGDPGPKFFLFHRARLWNPREQVWMGWERKRGKLEEFNRLLRGATDTSFTDAGRPARRAARHPLRASRSIPTRSCRAIPRAS